MNIKLAILGLTAGCLTLACGNKNESSASETQTITEEVAVTEVGEEKEKNTNDIQYASISSENVDQLFSLYLEIKDALVKTDMETAKTKATNLAETFNSVTSNTFTEIISIANSIAESGEIEEQRTVFENLSKEVYEVIKSSKASSTVYKQYCPMALGNKGAFWLSNEKQVLNPYFGDKMLRCGSVEETISSNE